MDIAIRNLIKKHGWFLLGTISLIWFFRLAAFTGWDESFYLSQMTSVIQDRDLVLQNNLLKMPLPDIEKYKALSTVTDDGAILNCFSIGPAVVYSGFIFPAIIAEYSSDNHINLRRSMSICSMFILIFMVIGLTRIISFFGFSRNISCLTSGLIIVFSPLLVYGTRFYFNSHLFSAAFSVFSILNFLVWTESKKLRHAALCGLALGLMIITRWQNTVVLAGFIPFLVNQVFQTFTTRKSSDVSFRSLSKGLLVGLIALFSVCSIQLIAWKIQFNSWLLIPQGSDFLNWGNPSIVPFLFSNYHGMIPWIPGFALSIMGLLIAFYHTKDKTHRYLIGGFIIVCVGYIYVNSCVSDWWAGSSYGPRRLCSLLPFAAIGFAFLISRISRLKRVILISTLLIWALFGFGAFRGNIDDFSVLFELKTSDNNPSSLDTYYQDNTTQIWELWIDGFSKIIKPGFTLVDSPKNHDRLIGISVVLTISLLSIFLWMLISRSRKLQIFMAGFIWIWSALYATLLFITEPANRVADEYWLQVMNNQKSITATGPIPNGLLDAELFLKSVID